ncbi:type II toxin-antitoxin system death-on-curing family toxin [Pseudonocardia sp. RS11V-5]|uniref:type II toxin-antitoxin system death-on-curing family toxin n=1 Tax=Pseudonocardia terrae TaxID=2905831 RepID=UPI001E40EAF2|nr:type II toxin-antitoxin system death-on-curing family toxin [Pseudonocardia terrae]MCE3556098.1 type II toxin-antitoxin system death-on-curing family toxin [Pseudonocardia terrae]
MTEYLTLESLLQVAEAAIEGKVTVCDFGLLESAVARPRTTVFGAEAYPSMTEKAAALLESLARNHALVDGNKRLGWLATEVFCFLNGWLVVAADDDKFDLVIDVAAGVVPGVAKIAERLEPWLTPRVGDLGDGLVLTGRGAQKPWMWRWGRTAAGV